MIGNIHSVDIIANDLLVHRSSLVAASQGLAVPHLSGAPSRGLRSHPKVLEVKPVLCGA